jgi:hypothetical protein
MTTSPETLEVRILKALEQFESGLTTSELETLLQVDKRTLRPKVSKMIAARQIKKTSLAKRGGSTKGRPFSILQKPTKENQWT